MAVLKSSQITLRIYQLVSLECTGTKETLAQRLGISTRSIREHILTIEKTYGLTIEYKRKWGTYRIISKKTSILPPHLFRINSNYPSRKMEALLPVLNLFLYHNI